MCGGGARLGRYCTFRPFSSRPQCCFGYRGRLSTTLRDGIVVCPIDLPWITSATIRRLTDRADAISVVPDRHGSGTNLLWIPAAVIADFKFMFGPDSFTRHVEQGRKLGVAVETPALEEAGFDVDNPEDFAIWNERAHA